MFVESLVLCTINSPSSFILHVQIQYVISFIEGKFGNVDISQSSNYVLDKHVFFHKNPLAVTLLGWHDSLEAIKLCILTNFDRFEMASANVVNVIPTTMYRYFFLYDIWYNHDDAKSNWSCQVVSLVLSFWVLPLPSAFM